MVRAWHKHEEMLAKVYKNLKPLGSFLEIMYTFADKNHPRV